MTLEQLEIAIALCNNGGLTFNQHSNGFCYNGKWYPIVATVNQAVNGNHNLYKSMELILNILPFTGFKQNVEYEVPFPKQLSLPEIKEQLSRLASGIQRIVQ